MSFDILYVSWYLLLYRIPAPPCIICWSWLWYLLYHLLYLVGYHWGPIYSILTPWFSNRSCSSSRDDQALSILQSTRPTQLSPWSVHIILIIHYMEYYQFWTQTSAFLIHVLGFKNVTALYSCVTSESQHCTVVWLVSPSTVQLCD